MTHFVRPEKRLDPLLVVPRKDPTIKVKKVKKDLVPYMLLELVDNINLGISRGMNYARIVHKQMFTLSFHQIVEALESSAKGLDALIFFGALAPRSFRNYTYWYSRFLFHVYYYRDKKYQVIKDLDFHVIRAYLFSECRRGLRVGTVRGILSAIKYLLYPYSASFMFLYDGDVKLTHLFAFLDNHFRLEVVKKYPMTFFVLNKVLTIINFDNLTDVRDWLVMIVMHIAGPRGSEVAPLKWTDLQVDHYTDTYSHKEMTILMLFLPHSKTDKQGSPPTITISCPMEKDSFNIILVLRHYCLLLKKAGISSKWFLPSLLLRDRKKDIHISGNTISHITKDRVEQIGLDRNKYGSHSYRTAFVHDAIAAGVPVSLIKKTGRWRSDCWLGYFHDAQYAQSRATAALHSYGKEFRTSKSKKKDREFIKAITTGLGY